MTSIAEIKQAILGLTEAEYTELRRWLTDQDWEQWEREFDEDEESGRADWLLPRREDTFPDFFMKPPDFLLDNLLDNVPEFDGIAGAGPPTRRSGTPIASEGSPEPVVHRITGSFRHMFGNLPLRIQRAACQSYCLLKSDPTHPSLHFKKVGSFWSARVDRSHRAIAVEEGSGFRWNWIGGHDEYERQIARRR